MQSVPQQMAYDLYRKNTTADGGVHDRALEAAYLRAAQIARDAFRQVIDDHHPTPEFCAHCGEWTTRDDYLTSHVQHGLTAATGGTHDG